MDNYTTETAQLGFSVGSDHIMVCPKRLFIILQLCR